MIPRDVEEWLRSRGIEELYPIQRKAIERGLFEGRSLLVSAPTGSGKTLVAEMAIANALFEGKKAIYLVPLRSLAFEKVKGLREAFEGYKVEASVGDYHSPKVEDAEVLVATYERMDSLLRHSSPWLREVGVVVIDEVHYVGDEERGPVLETIVTQLKRKGFQMIALSATVGNLGEIADWLGAELVTDSWRPVPLKEGVMENREYVVWFEDSEEEIPRVTGSAPIDAALHFLKKGQVLYFATTRRNAERAAKRVAERLPVTKKGEYWAERAKIEVEGELGERLASLIRRGAGFHHAGLTNEAREVVEEAFRAGAIRFLAATPTLAAGVNLPARTVIIEDHYRFERFGRVPIKVAEYKQMAGRAGRPGLDEHGTSVLVTRDDVDEVFERYVKGKPESVISSLVSPRALRRTVLGLLASGFARNYEELKEFIEDTLYAQQVGNPRDALEEMDRAVRFLVKLGALDKEARITEFGRKISLVYVDPLGVKIVLKYLKRRKGKGSALGYLHLISLTPDMPKRSLRSNEFKRLYEVYQELEVDLIAMNIEEFEDEELFLSALKTALILKDWADEVPEDEIAKKYSVYPGDVRVFADTAAWLVHAYSELASFKGMKIHAESLAKLELRMKYGVREELVELVSIPYIGRSRARKLWESGIRSKDDLIQAGERRLASILGPKVAKRVLMEIQGKKEVTLRSFFG
ncbi:extensin [Ignicoccus pacificus DSM 13166]|uniref:ATP-dependent DNA helicase Hel308 n=1 Tax=Ignicoccus pacificus DSM 13166 TaxID=940294 RepID=A0A977K933_9CREN|nr:extensin [Ignicoccus pacificus DSM 13166]